MGVKLSLDPKKDNLVPCKAMKALASKLDEINKDENFIKKLFSSEKNREEKKKLIGEIKKSLEALPDDGKVWFAKRFLVATKGKVTDVIQELLADFLKAKVFDELSSSADAYNADLSAKTTAAAHVAQALTEKTKELSRIAGAYGVEYVKTKTLAPAAPAAAPAAVPESLARELYQSKKLLEFGFITESEHLVKLLEIRKKLFLEAVTLKANSAAWAAHLIKINPQIKLATFKAQMNKNGVRLPATFAEKDLVALKTATPAAPAPAPAPAGADPVAGAISTLVGTSEGDKESELVKLLTLAGAIQQGLTNLGKQVIAESLTLTATQRQFVKLFIKKQVLTEYAKTGVLTEKNQLNEFFLTALLLSALAGIVAWAASSLGKLFKGAYTGSAPSHRSHGSDPSQSTSNVVTTLGSGYGATNVIVDINNRPIADKNKAIDDAKKNLEQIGNAITQAVAIINTDKTDTVEPKRSAGIVAAFASSPATEITALNAALETLKAL